MPFEVTRRHDGNGRPRWWYVQRAEGSNDVPDLSVEVASQVDACALRNMLNSIHPDLMDRAFREAIAETGRSV